MRRLATGAACRFFDGCGQHLGAGLLIGWVLAVGGGVCCGALGVGGVGRFVDDGLSDDGGAGFAVLLLRVAVFEIVDRRHIWYVAGAVGRVGIGRFDRDDVGFAPHALGR